MGLSLNSVGKCGAKELVRLLRELEEEVLIGGAPGTGKVCQGAICGSHCRVGGPVCL